MVDRFKVLYRYKTLPLEILLILIWVYLFWRGTKFEQLFAGRPFKFLITAGFLDVIINFGFSLDAYIELDRKSTEVSIIILCTSLCELSIYARYLLMSLKLDHYSALLKDFDVYNEKKKAVD